MKHYGCGVLLGFALAALALQAHATAPFLNTPAPRDVAYPGTLTLRVDATDVQRRIFRAHETIPVKPGPLVLQYPQWLPGKHATAGPIDQLAGPQIRANGKPLEWQRNSSDVYSFHIVVPPGVTQLEIDLQFVSPQVREQGRTTMTPLILGAQWEKLLLYPAGYFSRRIQVASSIRLPAGWGYASALDGAHRTGNEITFAATSLETLVDSPLMAGRHFRSVALDPNTRAPVRIDIAGESAAEIEVPAKAQAAQEKLVAEATALFGSRHFDHYDFLLSTSDEYGSIGLEHHRSSEDGVSRGFYKDWDKSEPEHSVLSHEMTHSWNGKFRRPEDLWTPTYNVPMGGSLLWVYEGQTQLWGYVLAARSGLWSPEFTRGAFASSAAMLQDARPGRTWRSLQDTTNQPVVTPRRPQSFVSWQRTEEYYQEGALIWLEVDSIIRERSRGARSLEDFARRFFGVHDGSYVTETYTFDDIVRVLNDVQPNDWRRFLRSRLEDLAPANDEPVRALRQAGWRLVYRDTPSLFTKKSEALSGGSDRTYSIGLSLARDARVTSVLWDSPAFKGGITPSSTIVAVNGVSFSKDVLDQAILAAKDPALPVDLLVKTESRYQTVRLDYTGGPRFPDLERIEGSEDRLTELLKPKT